MEDIKLDGHRTIVKNAVFGRPLTSSEIPFEEFEGEKLVKVLRYRVPTPNEEIQFILETSLNRRAEGSTALYLDNFADVRKNLIERNLVYFDYLKNNDPETWDIPGAHYVGIIAGTVHNDSICAAEEMKGRGDFVYDNIIQNSSGNWFSSLKISRDGLLPARKKIEKELERRSKTSDIIDFEGSRKQYPEFAYYALSFFEALNSKRKISLLEDSSARVLDKMSSLRLVKLIYWLEDQKVIFSPLQENPHLNLRSFSSYSGLPN